MDGVCENSHVRKTLLCHKNHLYDTGESFYITKKSYNIKTYRVLKLIGVKNYRKQEEKIIKMRTNTVYNSYRLKYNRRKGGAYMRKNKRCRTDGFT